jgi:hypothetical protein
MKRMLQKISAMGRGELVPEALFDRKVGYNHPKARGRYAERPAYCQSTMQRDAETVGVLYYADTESAGFRGVVRCGSTWACPHCSPIISAKRRAELVGALTDGPYYVALLTLTLQHTWADPLESLKDALKAAYAAFFNGRTWRNLAVEIGYVGRVRGLEVTVGRNGWHPHLHILLVLDKPPDKDALESQLRPYWKGVVGRVGRYALLEYGLTVRCGPVEDLAGYPVKAGLDAPSGGGSWSLSDEVTATNKTARIEGRSPWQLLDDVAAGDERAGMLWLEYYWAMKGEKQLVFSKGLRELLQLGKAPTDAELAEDDAEGIVLAELTPQQWWVVLRCEARGPLLAVAATTGNRAAVMAYLAEIGALEGEAGQPP